MVGGLAAAAVAPAGCGGASVREESWRRFSTRFLMPEGRVVDTGNRGISHSEGQGYGLLLAEAAGDRTAFNQMLDWTRRTLERPDSGLLTWRYDPAEPASSADPNNATDGDILVAWALLRAHERWREPGYCHLSETLRAAILREAVVQHGGLSLLLPGRQGFVHDDHVVVNPSYYVWPALDAFARREPLWTPYIDGGLDLLSRAAFGRWRLPTDWVALDRDGRAAPAPDRPPRFGSDAIRVPLYLTWSGRKAELQPFVDFWSAAWTDAPPAWIDVTTEAQAEYPLSGGGRRVAALVLGRPDPAESGQDDDYYSQTLGRLVELSRQA